MSRYIPWDYEAFGYGNSGDISKRECRRAHEDAMPIVGLNVGPSLLSELDSKCILRALAESKALREVIGCTIIA